MLIGLPMASALFTVYTPWGRERMASIAVSTIREELGLHTTLGHVELDIFPPTLTATGITLDDPKYGRFAKTDQLIIRSSFFAFFRGSIDLEEIRLTAPELNLIVRNGAILNLPRPRNSRQTGPSGPSPVSVRKVVVTGARIAVDADPHGRAFLDGVTFTLHISDDNIVDVDLSAVSGAFEHKRGRESVQRLRAVARISPEGVDIDEFLFASPFVTVALKDSHLPIPFDNSYQGQVRLRVDLSHLASLPLPVTLPALTGVVTVSGEVTGTRDGPKADGTITVEDGHIEEWGTGDVVLRVRGDRHRIVVSDGVASIVKGGGKVGIKGEIGLEGTMPLKVALDLRGLEFAKLMDQLGVSKNAIEQWNLSGPIKLEGTILPLNIKGPLHLRTKDFLVTQGAWHETPAERVIGVTEAEVKSRVSIRPDGIRFEDIDALTPRSHIHADLLLGFDNQLRLHAYSDSLDLRDATPLLTFPIGGVGTVLVDITGTMSQMQLKGHLKFKDFIFDTFPMGDVETDGILDEDYEGVVFPEIVATKRKSRYTVKDLALDFRNGRFQTHGHVDVHDMALADFYDIFHFEEDERFADYQGRVQGSVDVKYTRGFPEDPPTGTMVTDMDLTVPEANLDGYAFHDGVFKGQWKWLNYERGIDGGILTIDHAFLHKGLGTMTLDGEMGLGGALKMTVAVDRLSVHEVEGLGTRFPALGGLLGVVADVRGTAGVPRVSLDVAMTGLSYGNTLLGDGRFFVKLTDKDDPWIREATTWAGGTAPAGAQCPAARAGFATGQWPTDPPVRTATGLKPRLEKPMAFVICGAALDGRFRSDLAIGRSRAFPLRGELAFQHFDLGPWLQHSWKDATMAGAISGKARFTDGAPTTLDTLSGSLALSEFKLSRGGVSVTAEDEIHVVVDKGNLSVERAVFAGPSSQLSIGGTASVARGLALTLRGDVDLGVLATLSRRVTEAEGRMAVQVDLGGALFDPTVIGRADITNGGFKYAGFPVPVTRMNGGITFSQRQILFDRFTADMAGGKLTLRGAAALKGLAIDHYDFAISGTKLALNPEDGVEVSASGDLALEWSKERRLPLLHGTIRLDRVLYARPIQLFQTLSLGDLASDKRASFDRYDPDNDRVDLDLRILSERPMRVSNNVIDAEFRIEDSERPFRIVGTDQRIGVLGTVLVSRGTVVFRNSLFDIRRGMIDFNDSTRLNPNFDLMAVTELRRSGGFTGPNWRINLHAHGSRDSFRLDTSSEPALSQEDIILLLTMGMTRAEADQLQAGDVTESAALEALATVTGVSREVKRAVPVIDDFRISSQYSPRTNRTEPQIAIGKRLTDRVRLNAATGLSDSRELRTAVEWQLSSRTSLQAAYDNVNTSTASAVGNIGVDVRWRLEFQ